MDKSPRYFTLGLKLGLIKPGQIQTWVDQQINQVDEPSKELIDLAFLGIDNEKEMYRILNDMPDDSDDFEALRKLFRDLEHFPFEDIHACAELAEKLYFIACEHDYNCPSEFNSILRLDDAFSLTMQGTWGDPNEVKKKLEDFVYSFK